MESLEVREAQTLAQSQKLLTLVEEKEAAQAAAAAADAALANLRDKFSAVSEVLILTSSFPAPEREGGGLRSGTE